MMGTHLLFLNLEGMSTQDDVIIAKCSDSVSRDLW